MLAIPHEGDDGMLPDAGKVNIPMPRERTALAPGAGFEAWCGRWRGRVRLSVNRPSVVATGGNRH